MVAGKAGPTPGPVNRQSKEEKMAAAEAAKAERERKKAEEKTAREGAAKQAKAEREAEKERKRQAAQAKGPTPSPVTQVTDLERRAIFVNGISGDGGIEDLIKEKDLVVTKIRNARKKIISYGFQAVDIDYALRLRKEDQKAMLEERRRQLQIAVFFNHPIGTEPDMFDVATQVDRTPAVEKAESDGFQAGAGGKAPCKPPFHEATEQAQRWIKGWHEGQAALLTGIKKLEPPAAEPPKPADGQKDMLDDGIGAANAPPTRTAGDETKPENETTH